MNKIRCRYCGIILFVDKYQETYNIRFCKECYRFMKSIQGGVKNDKVS